MEKDLDIVFNRLKLNSRPPCYNINYFYVRNNAWEFLLKNKIDTFPLNLHAIAEQNNWLIWSYKEYCQYKKIDEKDLISKHPDGFTKVIKDGHFLICYNEKNNKQRNRFTICHEIGHIILHNIYHGDKLEKEANMFAARILMPMVLIKELKISSPKELSNLCDVSFEAASYRLDRYNDISERNKFYSSRLEKKLYKKLKGFIKSYKKLRTNNQNDIYF